MDFTTCIKSNRSVLMEGALGERIKREFCLSFDEHVIMAGLVSTEDGRKALGQLWSEYAGIAEKYALPFLATTPTRRANQERVANSRFDSNVIQANVTILRQIQKQQKAKMYVGGMLGCKGDAYTGAGALGQWESRLFHSWEVSLFARAKVDFLYAALQPNVQEAAGIALAIEACRIPYIVSFTIRKDGRLIDGTAIADAIRYIDGITAFRPVCYMTNCVHPRILYEALSQPFNRNDTVRGRFQGIQANTSPLSYEELDHSDRLLTSEPGELARQMVRLREIAPFKIFGGCCGTDGRHMEEIAKLI